MFKRAIQKGLTHSVLVASFFFLDVLASIKVDQCIGGYRISAGKKNLNLIVIYSPSCSKPLQISFNVTQKGGGGTKNDENGCK